MNYLEKLEKVARENNSIVCLGYDPVLKALPEGPRGVEQLYEFLCAITYNGFEKGILPGAYKPNYGFYTVHDMKNKNGFKKFVGSEVLFQVIKDIQSVSTEHSKESIVILDAKQADIQTSSTNYAVTDFEGWEADACTVHPYMGDDSVNPFTAYCKNGKGVYVLTRTSNPGAKTFQNLELKDGRLVYEAVADKVIEWAKDAPGVGAVVGATSLLELEVLAAKFAAHNIPMLIPGVGGQGGSANDVITILKKVNYPLYLARINSSSGITHPWVKAGNPMPNNYPDVCIDELKKLNDEIGPIF